MLPSSTVCRRVSFACNARRRFSGKVRAAISRMKTNRNDKGTDATLRGF